MAARNPAIAIAWNNDAGRGGLGGMRAELPKSVAIGYVGYFNVGEVGFSSHIANIRNSGAKAVMLLMDEEPGALAIKQIRDAGLTVDLIGTLAMGSNRFLDRLNAKYVAGMAQYNAFPPNLPTPRIKAFNEAYKARFGESHGFAAQSYDGLHVAVEARRRPAPSATARRSRTRSPPFGRRRHPARSSSTARASVAAGLHHPMVRGRHAQVVFPDQYKRIAAVADPPVLRPRPVRADHQRHDDRASMC